MGTWREIGAATFVRRHRSADLNVGLVVGDTACLVIDTRLTHAEGRELVTAVRQVTSLPWYVANTHGHYDHCFGNAVFLPADIWGHKRAVAMLFEQADLKRQYFRGAAEARGDRQFVADLDEVEITAPNRTFTEGHDLDLGGRRVRLRHLGRGHTDNDIVVEVPDVGILYVGDLVEEGAPPVFGDSFPLDWPSTLDDVVAAADRWVVPGHGDVVDRGYVVEQAALMAAIADVARRAYEDDQPEDEALRDLPLPPDVGRVALQRAFRQLRGDPPNESADELRHRLGLP